MAWPRRTSPPRRTTPCPPPPIFGTIPPPSFIYGPPIPPPPVDPLTTEAARRQTLARYTPHETNPIYQSWYLETPQDPQIRSSMQDLYMDRAQTNEQQVSLADASEHLHRRIQNWRAMQTIASRRGLETMDTLLLDVYKRVLRLYDVRLRHIQHAGQRRLDVWDQLQNAPDTRTQDACQSTLAWVEHDYMLRKVDFVREVLACLWDWDRDRARDVVRDYSVLYPENMTRLIHGGPMMML